MARLAYYSSLREKGDHFQQAVVNTKEEFRAEYNILVDLCLKKRRGLIFRGLTEAKYKIYNSAQRNWINKELDKWGIDYHEMIKTTIRNAKQWQKSLLPKFYRAFGHQAYDLAVLSFLQHYGAPTPLSDWTYSLDCALFFAVDGIRYPESDNDIDNYFSIYAIQKAEHETEFINYAQLIKNERVKLKALTDSHQNIDASAVRRRLRDLPYDLMKGFQLVYISDMERMGLRKALYTMYTNTNLNIINQEGLFVYNNDPVKPIEDWFLGVTPAEGRTFFLPKIICLNLHKNLTDYVVKLLASKGITKAFIYPQEEALAKDSFLSVLSA